MFGRDLLKKRKDGGHLETGRGAGYGPLAHLIILLFLREVSELLTERLNTKEVSWKGEFYTDYDRIGLQDNIRSVLWSCQAPTQKKGRIT